MLYIHVRSMPHKQCVFFYASLAQRLEKLVEMCASVDGVFLALVGDGPVAPFLLERHGSWTIGGARKTRVSRFSKVLLSTFSGGVHTRIPRSVSVQYLSLAVFVRPVRSGVFPGTMSYFE